MWRVHYIISECSWCAFSAFLWEVFENLLPGRELRVYLAARRPSVRSPQSEYSGKVGVTLLTVNFMVACYHHDVHKVY